MVLILKIPMLTNFLSKMTGDIVLVWSVLHWIGRNEYLQSIGEIKNL